MVTSESRQARKITKAKGREMNNGEAAVTAEVAGYGTFTADGWDLDQAMRQYADANEVVLADTLVYAHAGDIRYQEVSQRTALLVMLCAAGRPDVPSHDALDNMYAILVLAP